MPLTNYDAFYERERERVLARSKKFYLKLRSIFIYLLFVVGFFVGFGQCYAADSTLYVSATSGVSGDYNFLLAGNDTTGDGTLAKPYAKISKAINSHISSVGETVTIIVKAGDTLVTDRPTFDDVSKTHNGINFIIKSSIPGTKYIVQSSSGTNFFRTNAATVVSGSLTIQDCQYSGTTSAFVQFAAEQGMNLIIKDSNLTTFSSYSIYLLGSTNTNPERNVTIENSVLNSVSGAIANQNSGDDGKYIAGNINISSSTITTNSSGIKINGQIGNMNLNNVVISYGTGWGILTDSSASAGNVTINNIDVSGTGYGIRLKDNIAQLVINDSRVQSSGNKALYLGEDTLSNVNSGVNQVQISNNSLTSGSEKALQLGFGVGDNAEIYGNISSGGTHQLTISSNHAHIYNNIINGNASPAMFNIGSYNTYNNNTVYGDIAGGAFLTGNGAAPTEQYYGHDNVVYNNIFVTKNVSGFAFWDYEGHAGGGTSRNGAITLQETVVNTTWNEAGTIMTGVGSGWTVFGPTKVRVNDIIRVISGTNTVAGDYLVSSVGSDTSITLSSSIGISPSGVTYTILRNDGMRDDVNNNVYWNTVNPNNINSINEIDGVDADTIEELKAIWPSWSPTHPNNDNSSIIVDPKFTNPNSSDFTLFSTSTAIDSGTTGSWITSTSTDYAGNPIYGTPDIGAYEYQPPFTIGTDDLDVTGDIRIYGNGKYRYTTATSSTMSANFSVSPPEGTWTYSASTTRPEWLNISDITWNTSGTYSKQWTASSTSATTTVYTIGDLQPSTQYTVKVDSATSTDITGDSCTASICESDGDGQIIFTYSGGYSTHDFNVDPASIPTLTTNSASSITTTSATANGNIDAIGDDSPTTRGFLYGTDSTLVTVIATTTETGTFGAGVFTTSLSGFTCGNTYYVRSYATNSGGTGYGGIVNFNTSACPSSSSGSRSIYYVPPVQNTATTTIATSTRPIITTTFFRDLQLGMTGDDVKELQRFLNNKGFTITHSGFGSLGNETNTFGSLTKQALIKFQISHSITPAIGYFGPLTRAVVNGTQVPSTASVSTTTSPFTRNLAYDSTGEDVRQLQIFLNTHGHTVSTTGPGSQGNETTLFGQATQSALIKFQIAQDITPAVGYFGPVTRKVVEGMR